MHGPCCIGVLSNYFWTFIRSLTHPLTISLFSKDLIIEYVYQQFMFFSSFTQHELYFSVGSIYTEPNQTNENVEISQNALQKGNYTLMI